MDIPIEIKIQPQNKIFKVTSTIEDKKKHFLDPKLEYVRASLVVNKYANFSPNISTQIWNKNAQVQKILSYSLQNIVIIIEHSCSFMSKGSGIIEIINNLMIKNQSGYRKNYLLDIICTYSPETRAENYADEVKKSIQP